MDGEFASDLPGTVIERGPALALPAEGPHRRGELEEELGLSKTTYHRVIRSFDERGCCGGPTGAPSADAAGTRRGGAPCPNCRRGAPCPNCRRGAPCPNCRRGGHAPSFGARSVRPVGRAPGF